MGLFENTGFSNGRKRNRGVNKISGNCGTCGENIITCNIMQQFSPYFSSGFPTVTPPPPPSPSPTPNTHQSNLLIIHKRRPSIPWQRFGNVFFFCEFLLWISPRIINSLRYYNVYQPLERVSSGFSTPWSHPLLGVSKLDETLSSCLKYYSKI